MDSLKLTIQKLNKEIEGLNQQVQQMNIQRNELESENFNLKQQISQAKNQVILFERENNVIELRSVAYNSEDQIQDLTLKLEKQIKETEKYQKDAFNNDQLAQSLQKRLSDINLQNQKIKQQYEIQIQELIKQINEKERLLQQTPKKVQELPQLQNTHLIQENEELLMKIGQQEQMIKNLQEEYYKQQGEFQKITKEYNTVINQSDNTVVTITQYQQQSDNIKRKDDLIKQLQQQIYDLQKKIDFDRNRYQDENNRLTIKNQELSNQLQNNHNKQIIEENFILKNQIQQLQQELNNTPIKETIIYQSTSPQKKSEDDIAKQKQQINSLQLRMNQMTSDYNLFEQQAEQEKLQLEKQIKQLQENQQKIQNENNLLQRQIETLQRQLQQIQKNRSNEINQELEFENKKLKSQLEISQLSQKQLQEELITVKSQVIQCKENLEDEQNQKKQLNLQIIQLEQRVSELKKQNTPQISMRSETTITRELKQDSLLEQKVNLLNIENGSLKKQLENVEAEYIQKLKLQQAQIKDLNNKVKELMEECSNKSNMLEETTQISISNDQSSEIRKLKDEKLYLQQEMQKQQQQFKKQIEKIQDDYEFRIEQLKVKISELKESKQVEINDDKRLLKENQMLADQIKHLQNELVMARSQIQDTQVVNIQNANDTNKVQQLQRKNDELTYQLERFKQSQANNEESQIKDKQLLNNQIRQLQNELSIIQKNESNMLKEKQILNDQIKQLQNELLIIKNNEQSLLKDKQLLIDQTRQLQNEVAVSKSQIQEYQISITQYTNNTNKVELLQKKNDELTYQLERFKQSQTNNEQSLLKDKQLLSDQLRQLQNELLIIKNNEQSLLKDKQLLIDQTRQLQNEVAVSKNQIQEYKISITQYTNNTNKVELLQKKNDELTYQLERFKQSQTNNEQSLLKDKQLLSDQLRQLQNELSIIKNNEQSLLKDKQLLIDQTRQLQNEVAVSKNQIQEYQISITQYTNNTNKVELLQKKNDELTYQLERFKQSQTNNEQSLLKDKQLLSDQLRQLQNELSIIKNNEQNLLKDKQLLIDQLQQQQNELLIIKSNEKSLLKDKQILNDQLRQLKNELSLCKNNESCLLMDKQFLNDQIMQLQKDISFSKSQIQEFQLSTPQDLIAISKFQSLSQQNTELKQQIDQQNLFITQYNQQLKLAQTNSDKKEEELNNLKLNLQSVHGQLIQLQKESKVNLKNDSEYFSQLQDQISQNSLLSKQFKEENGFLKRSIFDKEKEIQSLNTIVNNLEGQIFDINQQNLKLVQQLKDQELLYCKLQESKDSYSLDSSKDLQKQLSIKQQEIQHIDAENKKLHNKLLYSQDFIKKQQQDLINYEGDKQKLYSQYLQETSALQNQIKQLQQEILNQQEMKRQLELIPQKIEINNPNSTIESPKAKNMSKSLNKSSASCHSTDDLRGNYYNCSLYATNNNRISYYSSLRAVKSKGDLLISHEKSLSTSEEELKKQIILWQQKYEELLTERYSKQNLITPKKERLTQEFTVSDESINWKLKYDELQRQIQLQNQNSKDKVIEQLRSKNELQYLHEVFQIFNNIHNLFFLKEPQFQSIKVNSSIILLKFSLQF